MRALGHMLMTLVSLGPVLPFNSIVHARHNGNRAEALQPTSTKSENACLASAAADDTADERCSYFVETKTAAALLTCGNSHLQHGNLPGCQMQDSVGCTQSSLLQASEMLSNMSTVDTAHWQTHSLAVSATQRLEPLVLPTIKACDGNATIMLALCNGKSGSLFQHYDNDKVGHLAATHCNGNVEDALDAATLNVWMQCVLDALLNALGSPSSKVRTGQLVDLKFWVQSCSLVHKRYLVVRLIQTSVWSTLSLLVLVEPSLPNFHPTP